MEAPLSWIIQQRALVTLSLITAILVLLPLPGFIQNRNIGCSLYASWIAVLCFTSFVNDVIWRDNAVNFAPIWCDIHVRLQYAGSMGFLSAGLVIARRVSLIATSSVAYLSSEDKTRAMWIDLAIGLSPPIAQIIEYWFMTGHRFNLLEGLGCQPAMPLSILNLTLTWIPNIIIGLMSAYYCLRTLHALLRRHKHIKQVVAMSNMDLQLFHRLIAMACVELLCTIPLVTYTLVISLTVSPGYYPWNGFEDLHLGFDRMPQFPYALWANDCSLCTQTQWFQIGCGIIFFLLLGLTREARARYVRMFGLSRLFPENNGTSQSWFCLRRRTKQSGPLVTTVQFNHSSTSTMDSSQSLTYYNNKTEEIV